MTIRGGRHFGVLLMLASLGACADSGGDPELYSLTVQEEGYDITFTEVERTPSSSVVEWVQAESPTVTASGVVLMRGAVDIALERGFSHLLVVPESRPTAEDPGRFRILLTNDPGTPLEDLVGLTPTREMQQMFDQRGYIAVDDLARFFGIR